VLGQIWQANDRALWTYLPKPCPGVVTDIRPAKQYRIFSKPDLKWDGLTQGQDVIVLAVFPGTMLIEPFVVHLAGALRKSIAAATQRIQASSSGESVANAR
jgi:hypothetical protein